MKMEETKTSAWRPNSSPAAKGRKRAFIAGAYFCFLLAAIGSTFFQPAHDWDMIGFAAVMASWHTSNPVEIQHRVYQQIRRATPPATYQELTTGPFRHDVATNPLHLAEQIPFYSIKPLYLDLVWLGHSLGMGLQRSMRLISVLSVLALGILCFQWMRIYLTDLQSSIISACLFITAPMHHLARFNEPDALNTIALAAALYLLFERNRKFPGLLLLCISPLIRPDSAILALLVLAYLAVLSPAGLAVRKLYALALAATVGVTLLMISRFSGNYGWKMLFANTFISPIPNPGEVSPSVTPADYWSALRSASVQFLSGNGLVLFVFVIALFLLAGVATINPALRDLLIILTIAIACHVALFPSLQARFFSFAYVPTAVGYAACLSEWKRWKPA